MYFAVPEARKRAGQMSWVAFAQKASLEGEGNNGATNPFLCARLLLQTELDEAVRQRVPERYAM